MNRLVFALEPARLDGTLLFGRGLQEARALLLHLELEVFVALLQQSVHLAATHEEGGRRTSDNFAAIREEVLRLPPELSSQVRVAACLLQIGSPCKLFTPPPRSSPVSENLALDLRITEKATDITT